jgi:metal-responsive CopG/Arc/MetJ family transcriptional regulator
MTQSKPESFTRAPRGRGRASRISVSLHDSLFRQLEELAHAEGRSLSNLCAHLIETALTDHRGSSSPPDRR